MVVKRITLWRVLTASTHNHPCLSCFQLIPPCVNGLGLNLVNMGLSGWINYVTVISSKRIQQWLHWKSILRRINISWSYHLGYRLRLSFNTLSPMNCIDTKLRVVFLLPGSLFTHHICNMKLNPIEAKVLDMLGSPLSDKQLAFKLGVNLLTIHSALECLRGKNLVAYSWDAEHGCQWVVTKRFHSWQPVSGMTYW